MIQCGLHGSSRTNPHADLAVNESNRPGRLSNTRGAAAVAHWDVPDCGNCEWFSCVGLPPAGALRPSLALSPAALLTHATFPLPPPDIVTRTKVSLKDNSHLNSAYGGYCVFASVEAGDAASWRTVDAIAAAVPAGKHPAIASVEVV